MKIDVTRTEVVVGNGYIVNKGEYKINPCEFTFSEEYTAELVKKAVFDDGKTEKEMAIINNKCDIPYEVLDSDSFVLRVYAYQVVNEELELVYSPTPATVYLREGSYRGVTGLGEVITATQFEQYEQALNDGLNELEEGLNEVANVDIDVSKTGTTATVTITNRQGTEKSVEIQDGTDYVLTQEDKQEIIDIVEAEVSLDIPTKNSQLENDSGFITKEVNNLTNYTLKTSTGSSIELLINNSTYVMTLNLKNSAGTTISTGTIDLPLETMVVGATYDNTNKKIVLTLKNGSTIDVPVADLISGLQSEITNANKLSADLVDDSNSINKFTSDTEKNSWNAKYDKPSGGIPSTDMSSSVQTSLEKADTAIQDVSGKEDKSNKTGILDENSTDTQYPHAKAVYDNFVTRDEEIEKLQTENAQLLADHPDILDENNEFPSGTDLTLNGTGDLKMSVDVGGNSTQETTTGKNKLAPSEEYTATNFGVTATSDGKGNYTLKGTSTGAEFIHRANIENYTIQEGDYVHLKNEGIIGTSSFVLMLNEGNISIIPNVKNKIFDLSSYIGKKVIATNFYVNNNNTMDISLSPMIVNSSTETDFEEYTGGQASPNPTYKQDINNVEGNVVVNSLRSNNFLNPEKVVQDNNSSNIYITDDKQYIRFLTNAEKMKIIPTNIQEKTAYTYKLIFKNGSDGLNQFVLNANYTDGTVEQLNTVQNVGTNSTKTYIVTTNEEKTLINIGMEHSVSKEAFLQIEGSMIAKGAYTEQTLHEYREYAENTVTFPLSQEQKLMLGDTLEDDGVHHKRTQTTFTGTTVTLSNAKTNGAYLCDQKTSGNLNGQTLTFDNAVTNAIIEYELATETITPYTSAQQTAYNKLKEMQSYYDLTYVVGSSNNAQPILTVQAKKSLKVIQDEIDNIESRLSLLE